jgi:hypothetical protein
MLESRGDMSSAKKKIDVYIFEHQSADHDF